ncbi:MAG: S8 family serine peptidase, partial [Chloroflexota bacterium]|nr:S8 family serine peptidase [Chloroflexota bacterium]
SLRGYQHYLDRIGDNQTPAIPNTAPVVAVIDTGLDYTHPDIRSNYQACPAVPGLYCDLVAYDQDPMDMLGHGTHVASTIAANDDAMGIRGVSPNSKVLPVRIFDEAGFTDLMTIFQALDYTMQAKVQIPNLRVANMSWGGLVLAGSAEHQEYNNRLGALRRAGILPVASAGNDSSFAVQAYPMILGVEVAIVPAHSPGVLAVAATDQNDYRTFFSAYSTLIRVNNCAKKYDYGDGYYECAADNTYRDKTMTRVQVAAPGWQVLAATTGGQYVQYAGTSMASPIVAGAAARIMAKNSGLSVDQVQQRIIDTGRRLGTTKGFPITTNRLDLRRALGVGGTGFTGRVVDGVTGQPLDGATVTLRSSAGVVGTATTSVSGFYTIRRALRNVQYTLTAQKGSAPAYVTVSRSVTAESGQFRDPGDISLAPRRTDGAYTMMLEWRNVLTGVNEWELENTFIDYNANKRYPWPVKGSSMPFALMDSYFGVPHPEELNDSVEFFWANPGSMAAFPYGRVDDWGVEASPHAGVVVRQLPAVRALRYGVKWLSPGGPTRPGAVVSVYRNNTLLRRSGLASASAPTDGTVGSGGSPEKPTTWALYQISYTGTLTMLSANLHGVRTDYQDWIHRNNAIRGTVGPSVGRSLSARLDGSGGSNPGVWAADQVDVYNILLVAGRTYTFKLNGPAGTEFDLALYGPKSVNFWGESLAYSGNQGSAETIRYTVPAGKSGRYYIAPISYGSSGSYTLSRP